MSQLITCCPKRFWGSLLISSTNFRKRCPYFLRGSASCFVDIYLSLSSINGGSLSSKDSRSVTLLSRFILLLKEERVVAPKYGINRHSKDVCLAIRSFS